MKSWQTRWAIIIVLFCLAVGWNYWADHTDPQNADATPQQSQASPRDFVVFVKGAAVSGSGVVIAPNTVLTAKHIVEVRGGLFVEIDGSPVLATSVFQYATTDAAYLKVAIACPCIDKTAVPEIDENVIIAGFPYGVTTHLKVVNTGVFQGYTVVEGVRVGISTAPVAPGYSGGAVFVERDHKLYLVGIITLALGPNISGFVPVVDLEPSPFK